MNDIKRTNRRNLIRRTSTPSVVPTIPLLGDTFNDSWDDTDIMVGELFMNTADGKLWFRDDNGIKLLWYDGIVASFIDLPDTPLSYEPGKMLVCGDDSIEFVDIPTSLIQSMSDLSDFEDLSGKSGFMVVLGEDEETFELVPISFSQIQSDWAQTDDGQVDYIKNKPTLFSGDYNDLDNKPTIPSAQIQSDWAQTDDGQVDYIKNKPKLDYYLKIEMDGSLDDTGGDFKIISSTTLPETGVFYNWFNADSIGLLTLQNTGTSVVTVEHSDSPNTYIGQIGCNVEINGHVYNLYYFYYNVVTSG